MPDQDGLITGEDEGGSGSEEAEEGGGLVAGEGGIHGWG